MRNFARPSLFCGSGSLLVLGSKRDGPKPTIFDVWCSDPVITRWADNFSLNRLQQELEDKETWPYPQQDLGGIEDHPQARGLRELSLGSAMPYQDFPMRAVSAVSTRVSPHKPKLSFTATAISCSEPR